MRDKLNNDPKAQIGMIALLVIVGAFLLISSMGGGGGEATEEPASTETPAASTETPAAATSGEVVSAPVEDAAAEASVSAAVPSALPSSIQAPPLPAPVRQAYRENKTVVLLIKHDSGIDDRLVAKSVADISSSLSNVAVFVVPSSQIYRYASITLGVEVSRVPALVVMRPRNLSGGTPQASVSYGFQSTQSVLQAVRDGSYHGPGETYHPE
jgi:hypothetical protein